MVHAAINDIGSRFNRRLLLNLDEGLRFHEYFLKNDINIVINKVLQRYSGGIFIWFLMIILIVKHRLGIKWANLAIYSNLLKIRNTEFHMD